MDKFFGFVLTAVIAGVGAVIMIAIAIRAWYIITGQRPQKPPEDKHE